jgi:hypothetical protein
MDALQNPKALIEGQHTAEQLAHLDATRLKARKAKAGIVECNESLDALDAEFRASPVGAIEKISQYIAATDHPIDDFIGEIRLMAFKYAPRGWARCDGSLLGISKNTTIFPLLGTRFGGDGIKTFALPLITGPDPKAGQHLQYYIRVAEGVYPTHQYH